MLGSSFGLTWAYVMFGPTWGDLGLLEAILDHLGGSELIFGPTWGYLGRFEAILGHVVSIFGPPLATSWNISGSLGTILAACLLPHVASIGATS